MVKIIIPFVIPKEVKVLTKAGFTLSSNGVCKTNSSQRFGPRTSLRTIPIQTYTPKTSPADLGISQKSEYLGLLGNTQNLSSVLCFSNIGKLTHLGNWIRKGIDSLSNKAPTSPSFPNNYNNCIFILYTAECKDIYMCLVVWLCMCVCGWQGDH
uniref:Uncharacterized protein n=1 Tax=Cacopsylla melanoneura TaxID=428564 RepID=A0A8D9BN24_9HEMI